MIQDPVKGEKQKNEFQAFGIRQAKAELETSTGRESRFEYEEAADVRQKRKSSAVEEGLGNKVEGDIEDKVDEADKNK